MITSRRKTPLFHSRCGISIIVGELPICLSGCQQQWIARSKKEILEVNRTELACGMDEKDEETYAVRANSGIPGQKKLIKPTKNWTMNRATVAMPHHECIEYKFGNGSRSPVAGLRFKS